MPVRGTLAIPGDKSISHRSLMLAALADGISVIHNISRGNDVESTRDCLEACGIKSKRTADTVEITGGRLADPETELDCGNSGTTARLLLGLLAGQGVNATMTGDKSLSSRPMGRVIDPLTEMGADITSKNGCLPLNINASNLSGIDYLPKVASAQVKSAVLLAGLGADGTTSVTEALPTRNHTENMLSSLGAEIDISGLRTEVEKLKRPLDNFVITVPGDPSTGAFFAAAAAATPESRLVLKSVSLNKTRIGFYSVLEKMGATVEYHQKGVVLGEPHGDIVVKPGELQGISIGPAEIPGLIDEIPVLAVLAAQASGRTEIRGAAELRVKESDRISAIVSNLEKCGVNVTEFEDGLAVEGPSQINKCSIESRGDHRIAMAFAIANIISGEPVTVDNMDCIAISAPEFLKSLSVLGMEMNV